MFDGADKDPNLKPLFQAESSSQSTPLVPGSPQQQATVGAKATLDQAGQKTLAQNGVVDGELEALGEEAPQVEELLELQEARGEAAKSGVAQKPINGTGEPGAKLKGVQTDTVDAKELEALLRSGGGAAFLDSVDHLSQSKAQAVGGDAQKNGPGMQGNHALSGADFLSTLSTVKGASAQGNGAGADSGMGSGGNPSAGLARQGDDFGLKKSKTITFGQSDSPVQSQSMAGLSHSSVGVGAASVMKPGEMQGHVTQGAMTQDRLTSETLMGVSNNIRAMTPQGGGEMRLHLRPDNLGELHVRVMTDGQKVGLQIQASNDKAKQILESSLNDLRDKLSSHQLSLEKVELAVASPGASSSSSGHSRGDTAGDPSSQRGWGGMSDMWNGSSGSNAQAWSDAREGASASGNGWDAAPLRTASPARASSFLANSQMASNSGARSRLDVLA